MAEDKAALIIEDAPLEYNVTFEANARGGENEVDPTAGAGFQFIHSVYF